MGNLQSDTPNSQPVSTNDQEESHFEDEINLIDYFRVVWKWKSLILLGSVSPALIVGLILFFWPRNYKVTYVYDVRGQSVYDVRGQSIYDVRDQSIYDVRDQSVYDVSNWSLNEKNYNVLLDRFYSAENINKIVNKLRENGLDMYADRIQAAELKDFVEFTVLPPYMDLSKAKVTDPVRLQQIRQLKALLLNMTIISRLKNDISKISLVIRDDLENVIPVYFAEEQLNATIRGYKARMADIESNRFSIELALKTNRFALEKLKNMKAKTPDKIERDIILQFDVGGRSEYLPLGYQVQAVESKIVELEKQVTTNEGRYDHYKDLLALTERLSAELKTSISSYYTIQQFHSFLTELTGYYKAAELKDYLASYIKRIENRMSASAPVSENPKISPVAKGMVKKTAIVLVISFMISVFAAFLLEGLEKSQTQTS